MCYKSLGFWRSSRYSAGVIDILREISCPRRIVWQDNALRRRLTGSGHAGTKILTEYLVIAKQYWKRKQKPFGFISESMKGKRKNTCAILLSILTNWNSNQSLVHLSRQQLRVLSGAWFVTYRTCTWSMTLCNFE